MSAGIPQGLGEALAPATPRDPRALVTEARRIASTYPLEARDTPRWERERYLTEVQQLAWMLRFNPEAAAELLSAQMNICGVGSSDVAVTASGLPHHHANFERRHG